MVERLRLRAWWREAPPLHSTASPIWGQVPPIRLSFSEWLSLFAPALLPDLSEADVEPTEEGFRLRSTFTQDWAADWVHLTPLAYVRQGWEALDPEGWLAESLGQRWWLPESTLPALRAAAQLEEALGQFPLDVATVLRFPLPLERLCPLLRVWRGWLEPSAIERVLSLLLERADPVAALLQFQLVFSPLAACQQGPLPGDLAAYYADTLDEAPALLALTQTLIIWCQGSLGRWPRDLLPHLWDHAPAGWAQRVEALTRDRMRLSAALGSAAQAQVVLEALPDRRSPALLAALASGCSSATWERLLTVFQQQWGIACPGSPPSPEVTQGAVRLLLTFGARWHEWVSWCRRQGLDLHRATDLLPLEPQPALGAWLLDHRRLPLEGLRVVAWHWPRAGFPQQGSLAQIEGFLSQKGEPFFRPRRCVVCREATHYGRLDPPSVAPSVQTVWDRRPTPRQTRPGKGSPPAGPPSRSSSR